MAWASSTRSSRLPRDWRSRRLKTLRRDGYLCQLRYPDICTTKATCVDHINDDDDHDALQSACEPCNQHKNHLNRRTSPSTRHPAERHPGRLD